MTRPHNEGFKNNKCGQFYLDYIKNHRLGRYTTLLTEGTLNARLHEIDLDANEMLDTIIPRLAAERGIDGNLKARDMLRWVAEMNNIKVSTERKEIFEKFHDCWSEYMSLAEAAIFEYAFKLGAKFMLESLTDHN